MGSGRLPLTALRCFESAGRLLSFTAAAGELFVTQAAISCQIRDLEQNLGTPLFERHHRRVALTETGARLLARVTCGFDVLDEGLREAQSAKPATVLVISVEPSFAACWLVSRLDRFRAIRPEIDVEFLSDPRFIEFRTSRAELAIRYSLKETAWPRVEAHHLVQCLVTPVLAPALLAAGPPLRQPDDLSRYTLLHEDGRLFWASWMEQAGVVAADTSRGPLYNDHGSILPAARHGHGVALANLILVGDDLKAGHLVAPFDLQVQFGNY